MESCNCHRMRRTDNPTFFESFVEQCYHRNITADDAYFLYKQACLGEELALNPEMQSGFDEALEKLASTSPMDVFDTPTKNTLQWAGGGGAMGGVLSHYLPMLREIRNPWIRTLSGLVAGTGVGGAMGALTGKAQKDMHAAPRVDSLYVPRGMGGLGGAMGGGPNPMHEQYQSTLQKMQAMDAQIAELEKARSGISAGGGLADQLRYADLAHRLQHLQNQRGSLHGELQQMHNTALGDQERAQRSANSTGEDLRRTINFREGDANRMGQRLRETVDQTGPTGWLNRQWNRLTGFNNRAEKMNSELQGDYTARDFLHNQFQPKLDNYVPPLPA